MSLGMHSVKVYWLGENTVKEIIYQTYNWWVDLGTLYSCTTMVNILDQFFGGLFKTYSQKDNMFTVCNFKSV